VGSLNQSKPPMLGLRRMGVAAGFFGTTASQRRCPRSRAGWASLLWRTTTGVRSSAMRARLRARREAPSTSPPTITGAAGDSASPALIGDACAMTSAPAYDADGAAETIATGAASTAAPPLDVWQPASARATRRASGRCGMGAGEYGFGPGPCYARGR